MEEVQIEIEARDRSGTSAARSYRGEEKVPCVVYGGGLEDNLHGLLELKSFVHTAERALPTQVFRTKSDKKEINDRRLIVRDIQLDPVKGRVLHVDFQLLEGDRKVKLMVPLVVTGEPNGVKNQGGVLTIQARDIKVRATAKSIPHQVTIDVSHLNIGQRVTAEQVELPEGVELRDSASKTIANVVSSRSSRLDEAPTAEGGAAAAGGEKKDATAAGGAEKKPA